MIDLGINLFQEIAALGGGGGFSITSSLRFNDDDSAYLSRTPSVAGDRKTWTWSGWVKRGNVGITATLFTSDKDVIRFQSDDTIAFFLNDGVTVMCLTNAVYRDTSGWYHIVATYDSTEATSSNRMKIYVNGIQQTFSSASYPSLNQDSQFNNTVSHTHGVNSVAAIIRLFDGYMAEVNFIDGQALTPDDFGEISEDTGEWIPKRYAGTYGTNGFYLPFDGNANDDSGNGNNWTENNLASTDYMIDTPTNNFATLNPLDPLTTGTLSDGNLVTSGNAKVSLRPTSGQWYYEKDGVGISYDADTSGQFNPTLAAGSYNFGQYAWADTGPTGTEKALCTDNLPAPAIEQPETQFNVVLDTGANIKATAEALYDSSLIWIKDRANSNNHQLIDTVRGTGVLRSNTTAAETTYSAPSGNSVAWVWKAGGTAVSNTDGSITSQVSANVDAGFSIVSYTGNGLLGETIGHGLNSALEMIIVKNRDRVIDWTIYHEAIGATAYIEFDIDASAVASSRWNDTAPTSTLFTIGNSARVNESASSHIAYCFHSVEGFSKFGSYVGNGSADGPFVYTGFKPAFIMYKLAIGGTGNWIISDNMREGYNWDNPSLYPNLTNIESNASSLDILCNGFKINGTGSSHNASGSTYIYMAFAEHPFKEALAR